MQYVTDSFLAKRYGVSRTTIWRWARVGRIPKPTRLSDGCTRWRLDQIEALDRKRDAAA